VDQVTTVADSGEIMPHKSTYFYPKILTGLLINKLVADEKIELVGASGTGDRLSLSIRLPGLPP